MKGMITRFAKKGQSGFSLVELMIVVAIIGILAALAVPKFATFQAKARQSEGKTNLSHIYTLQVSYHGDNDTYAPMANHGRTGLCAANPIGFRVVGCEIANKPRYTYASTAAAFTFLGTATSAANVIVTSCASVDTWNLDQLKNLRSSVDAVRICP